ncbi:MAG: hypothetical protein ACXWAT_17555 [Methylobacter sp.]
MDNVDLDLARVDFQNEAVRGSTVDQKTLSKSLLQYFETSTATGNINRFVFHHNVFHHNIDSQTISKRTNEYVMFSSISPLFQRLSYS